MDPMRKTALWAGVLYLLTFVSIPSRFALYGPGEGGGLHSRSWSRHRRPRGRRYWS